MGSIVSMCDRVRWWHCSAVRNDILQMSWRWWSCTTLWYDHLQSRPMRYLWWVAIPSRNMCGKTLQHGLSIRTRGTWDESRILHESPAQEEIGPQWKGSMRHLLHVPFRNMHQPSPDLHLPSCDRKRLRCKQTCTADKFAIKYRNCYFLALVNCVKHSNGFYRYLCIINFLCTVSNHCLVTIAW